MKACEELFWFKYLSSLAIQFKRQHTLKECMYLGLRSGVTPYPCTGKVRRQSGVEDRRGAVFYSVALGKSHVFKAPVSSFVILEGWMARL